VGPSQEHGGGHLGRLLKDEQFPLDVVSIWQIVMGENEERSKPRVRRSGWFKLGPVLRSIVRQGMEVQYTCIRPQKKRSHAEVHVIFTRTFISYDHQIEIESLTESANAFQRVQIWRGPFLQEFAELQLHSLEQVWTRRDIEGLADQTEGEDGILLVVAITDNP
jgi:hypothetical protein